MKEDIVKTIAEQTKAARVVVSHADRYAAYVGLDVHKDTIAVAVALPGRDEPLYRNVINLRPNSLFCRKISSIHHHLKESEMNSVPAVPTTDQAVLPKII